MADEQNQTTVIPQVPIRSPMWDGPGMASLGNLTRTWIYFFERRFGGSGSGTGGGPFQRTLLLKDTTVGNDIADHVTIWVAGTAASVQAVLRKAITVDLTVRINVTVSGITTALGTFTIPHTTAVNAALTFASTSFTGSTTFPVLGVLSWDVTASDGSKDGAGIASFSVLWQ